MGYKSREVYPVSPFPVVEKKAIKEGPLPTTINDYACTHCDAIKESIGGPPEELCDCSIPPIQGQEPPVKKWKLVFTALPQIRVEHASVIEYGINRNREKMKKMYEEDAAPGSDAQKALADITEQVEHVPHSDEEE